MALTRLLPRAIQMYKWCSENWEYNHLSSDFFIRSDVLFLVRLKLKLITLRNRRVNPQWLHTMLHTDNQGLFQHSYCYHGFMQAQPQIWLLATYRDGPRVGSPLTLCGCCIVVCTGSWIWIIGVGMIISFGSCHCCTSHLLAAVWDSSLSFLLFAFGSHTKGKDPSINNLHAFKP